MTIYYITKYIITESIKISEEHINEHLSIMSTLEEFCKAEHKGKKMLEYIKIYIF